VYDTVTVAGRPNAGRRAPGRWFHGGSHADEARLSTDRL